MPYRQIIAAAYDAGVEEEYCRLAGTPSGEAEYRLITELLAEYVPDGSIVIDIGAGPGRYAEYLLQRDCKVGLVDLSAKSLKAFSDRIENSYCRRNIIFNKVSCATQLNWIRDNTADAILLMGPMYHLVNEDHRNIALANCRRILKPGGVLFTVFLTPHLLVHNDSEYITNHLYANVTTANFQGFDVPQFRCRPYEAKAIMKMNNFENIRVHSIESTYTYIPFDKINNNTEEEKKLNSPKSLLSTYEFEDVIGITHQFIIIGKQI
jgi:ubiquinone/menaquinone biosynthesis C-methylase UbiE